MLKDDRMKPTQQHSIFTADDDDFADILDVP
jgi:hypothetical protein